MVDNADTDSAAELEHKVWEDACAWKCQYAPANIPPELVQNPPTDLMRTYTENDEYPEKFGHIWDVRISVIPPAKHAGRGPFLALIGRRASVGGSAAPC